MGKHKAVRKMAIDIKKLGLIKAAVILFGLYFVCVLYSFLSISLKLNLIIFYEIIRVSSALDILTILLSKITLLYMLLTKDTMLNEQEDIFIETFKDEYIHNIGDY